MKKLIIAALISVSLFSAAFASPTKNVSVDITNSFQAIYPQVREVQWVVAKDFTKAVFTLNGIKTEAFYNGAGAYIGTSQAAVVEDLPIFAKRGLAKKYADFVVKEAIKFEGTDEVAYFVSVENNRQSLILKVDSGNIYIFKATNK